MTTKLDRVVGSNANLLSTKSHDQSITWPHKAIKQMKNAIKSFSRNLWLLKMTETWIILRSDHV